MKTWYFQRKKKSIHYIKQNYILIVKSEAQDVLKCSFYLTISEADDEIKCSYKKKTVLLITLYRLFDVIIDSRFCMKSKELNLSKAETKWCVSIYYTTAMNRMDL